MKHHPIFFFSLLLGLFSPAIASANYVDPPSRAGRVSLIEGSVMFYEEQAGWRDAAVNYPVTSQNSLATRGRSRTEIRIGSTALRIADDSQLDLLGITDNMIDARLTQGSLNLRVRNLEPGDTVRVSTAQSQTTIRAPGRYRIDADNQATRVTVLQGSAGVAAAGAAESILYAGTGTVVGGNYNRPLETAQSDAFDDWARERDYRFERSLSAQYVSPEMTGYESLDGYGAWRNDSNYGNVWVPTHAASGWAPYQDGRWVNVQPWGWTWVDNAPWGFAPFHYGRWVQVNGFWAWAPGHYHARPVYAPALVAFVGEPGWSASFSFGNAPAVGWFPLGWNEPYYPYYHCSTQYGRNLNAPHGNNYVHNDRHRDRPTIHRAYMTIVPRDKFTNPIIAAVKAAQPAPNNVPIARTIPIAAPALTRAVMAPAPGLERPVVGAMNRVMNTPPAPATEIPPAQTRVDRPWHRQPQPVIAQPGAAQTIPQPVAQPNAQIPNDDYRGHRPRVIPAPRPNNPIVRAVEPAPHPPVPVMQTAPQQVVHPQPVPQPAPQATPVAAVKADSDNRRRHREDGDNNGNERRMLTR